MLFVIREIATAEGTLLTYFLVHMWRTRGQFQAGLAALLVDEFLMQLITEETRVITNAAGHLKITDGTFVDPTIIVAEDLFSALVYETVDIDLVSVISANIKAYWDRALTRKDTGDYTSDRAKTARRDGKVVRQNPGPPIKRDLSDPSGVLQVDSVQALLDVPIEVT